MKTVPDSNPLETGHLQRTYDQLRKGDLTLAGGDDFFKKCFVFNNFEENFLKFAAGSTACTYNGYKEQLALVNQVTPSPKGY